MIHYQIKSLDRKMGHIVIRFYNEHWSVEWNFELPVPVPDTEGIHRFIISRVPHEIFERKAQEVAGALGTMDHVEDMVGKEFTVPDRQPIQLLPLAALPKPQEVPKLTLRKVELLP